MLCHETQWMIGHALRARRQLSLKLTNSRWKYPLMRAVSIWSTLFIAAMTGSSVFAQNIQPSVAHLTTAFQANEDQNASEA
jgi:hypothetical protein